MGEGKCNAHVPISLAGLSLMLSGPSMAFFSTPGYSFWAMPHLIGIILLATGAPVLLFGLARSPKAASTRTLADRVLRSGVSVAVFMGACVVFMVDRAVGCTSLTLGLTPPIIGFCVSAGVGIMETKKGARGWYINWVVAVTFLMWIIGTMADPNRHFP